MTARLNYFKAAPDAFQAVLELENYVANSGLEKSLLHLLKLRASQLNGCAYCVDMHTKEARKDGLNEQWITLISVWHEAGIYSEKERAVLSWTEHLTKLNATGVPDNIYNNVKQYFTEEELTKLTVAIGIINVWNRLAVGFKTEHPIDK